MDWLNIVNTKKDQLLEELAVLIRINSVRDDMTVNQEKNAPYGKGIREALTAFLEIASKKGFKTAEYSGYAGRAEFGQGEEIVGIITHLDTVPAGDGWITDPFELVIKDGRIHGRGTIDNKGPVIAALTAMEIVRSIVKEPKRKVHLIVGCDEESGMGCIRHYKNVVTDYPTLGMTPDSCFPVIYGEKGIMRFKLTGVSKSIITSLSGGIRSNVVPGTAKAELSIGNMDVRNIAEAFDNYLKDNGITGSITYSGQKAIVEFVGVSCHAQQPEKGINAVAYLLDWVAKTFNDSFAYLTASLSKDFLGSGFEIDFYGKYMKELTMNLGIMNVRDGNFDMTYDIRYPNDITAEELEKKLRAKANEADSQWSLEILSNTLPLFVDPKSSFVTRLETIYRDITGDMETPLQTTGGGTYARMFENHVAFGPVVPSDEPLPAGVGTLHQANEAIELDLLLKLTAIYARAMYELVS